MAVAYDYTVQINGCDFDFENKCWFDEHYTVTEFIFDTLEEAREFVHNITAERALEWERQSNCNGLDVLIYKDEVLEDGNYDDFEIVGEREFVGSEENGTWL